MDYIDLRSDTVTQPTPEMREAMAKAKVADDVYGEDPTVNKLQEMAAEITGHEDALFVASGTMGNLSATLAHCGRGDEVILGKDNHMYRYEAGGISVLGGVHSCQLPNQPDGSLLIEDIESAIRSDDPHEPITRLIALENTHNRCGGTVQSVEYTRQVAVFAHSRGLKVHMDGARVFNAATSLGVPVKELTGLVDSVTFCLSKGLSAPVGSLLCGSKDFIKQAHRMRKILGGGMRQAGILAAAGIVALEKIAPRLGEDHVRAQQMVEGLSKNRGLVLDKGTPATNMIFMNLSKDIESSASDVASRLKEYGVLPGISGSRRFRLVLHYWISDRDVDKAIAAFDAVLK